MLCLALCLLLSSVHSQPIHIPVYTVTGTHYEVGYQLGVLGKQRLKEAFKYMNSSIATTKAYCKSRSFCEEMTTNNCAVFPEYCTELQGMADGSGIPFDDYMTSIWAGKLSILEILNNTLNATGGPDHCFTGGICAKYSTQVQCNSSPQCAWMFDSCFRRGNDDHCTDMQVVLPNGEHVMGHNEDANYYAGRTGFWWNVTYVNSPISKGFFGFGYAGSMPGWATAFNQYGVVVTNNELRPRLFVSNGISDAFMGRFLLDSKNMEDALSRATGAHPALYGYPAAITGGSYNIGYQDKIVNVELGGATTSIKYITATHNPIAFHMNVYLHSPIPNFCDVSSVHRMIRANQIEKTVHFGDPADVLKVLGDTEDREFPIFRRPTKTDDVYTLTTTLYKLPPNGWVKIWVGKNPLTHSGHPDYTMKLL